MIGRRDKVEAQWNVNEVLIDFGNGDVNDKVEAQWNVNSLNLFIIATGFADKLEAQWYVNKYYIDWLEKNVYSIKQKHSGM